MALTVNIGDPTTVEVSRGGEKFSDTRGVLGGFDRVGTTKQTMLILRNVDGDLVYGTLDASNVLTWSETRP